MRLQPAVIVTATRTPECRGMKGLHETCRVPKGDGRAVLSGAVGELLPRVATPAAALTWGGVAGSNVIPIAGASRGGPHVLRPSRLRGSPRLTLHPSGGLAFILRPMNYALRAWKQMS